jgi:hypothetical protein
MYFVSAIVGLAGKENHLSHYPWTKDKQAVSNILLYTQIKNLFFLISYHLMDILFI